LIKGLDAVLISISGGDSGGGSGFKGMPLPPESLVVCGQLKNKTNCIAMTAAIPVFKPLGFFIKSS
jgi:hypothetical protein